MGKFFIIAEISFSFYNLYVYYSNFFSLRNLVKVQMSSKVSTFIFILSFLDMAVKSLIITFDILSQNCKNFDIFVMNNGGILGMLSVVCG